MSATDPHTLTLSDAARLLDYGPMKLRALLRRHGVLDAKNLPRRPYVKSGDFRVEIREHRGAYDISHQYAVTLVSGRGLTLLRQIIDEHGEETPALRRRDRRPGNAAGQGRGPAASAGPLPGLG